MITLRAHINRISHVTVNVTDLDRAVAFWEQTFPLTRFADTGGRRQAFASFGIAEGEFRGAMLGDGSRFPGRDVHLVQWLDPKPQGAPYSELTNVGWYRISAITNDIYAAYRAAVASSSQPFSAPQSRGTFAFTDPDGVIMEYLSAGWIEILTNSPGLAQDGERMYHVNGNCRDLATSLDFYGGFLGLDPFLDVTPASSGTKSGPVLGSTSAPGASADYAAAFVGYRSDLRHPIDLVQWKSPATIGRAYDSPFNLGIVRVALEVDDLDAVHALAVRHETYGNQIASDIETWDLGDLGERRVLLMSDPDGLGIELIERPKYPRELQP